MALTSAGNDSVLNRMWSNNIMWDWIREFSLSPAQYLESGRLVSVYKVTGAETGVRICSVFTFDFV